MSQEPERETLVELLIGMADIAAGNREAKILVGGLPDTPQAFAAFDIGQRAASRSLIKTFELLQNLVAKAVRVILLLEQIELTGWSPRAMADRAETLGLIESGDAWSDLVKLRNKLAHEYPVRRLEQFATLTEAWSASDRLLTVADGIAIYAKTHLGLEPNG